MLETNWLFDDAINPETRLRALNDWIAERRGKPADKETQVLLAYLLTARPVALPLHELFPDEPAMDLTLLNPHHLPPDELHMDERDAMQFVWRHTPLSWNTVVAMEDADTKYHAIIGLMPWGAAFESETAHREALARYEIVTRPGANGLPVHDEDVLWYVAARDAGVAREDAALFIRFKTIYMYTLGIVEDDVGTTAV